MTINYFELNIFYWVLKKLREKIEHKYHKVKEIFEYKFVNNIFILEIEKDDLLFYFFCILCEHLRNF